MFPGLRIEALPPPPPLKIQRECIYTVLKRRTRKFNFRCYVLNIVKINISFYLSKVGSPGPIYRPSVPYSWIELANLLAFHATIVESSWPIYRSSVPIRQDFWANLSTHRSQRVNIEKLLL